jgi:hypothetical protein
MDIYRHGTSEAKAACLLRAPCPNLDLTQWGGRGGHWLGLGVSHHNLDGLGQGRRRLMDWCRVGKQPEWVC